MGEEHDPLPVQLARMEADLKHIKKAVDRLSSHEVRLDRVEQTQKRAGKLAWALAVPLIGVVVEAVWRKMTGGH